jgi:prefoldin subunit 5
MANNMIIIGIPIALDINREAQMEEQKEKVKLDFKNLNDAYVIVKRYNGGVYFKRVDYVTDVKGYPKANCVYYTKESAEAKVLELNTNRSKCKYSVESAGKYFINMYTVSTYNNIVISNEPVSIKDFEANRFNKNSLYKTLNEAIEFAKNKTNESVKNHEYHADNAIKSLPQEIERITKQANDRHQMYTKSANEYKELVDKLDTLKNQDFKEYETQGDKIARVLYAKSETTTKDNRTLTTQDIP